MTAVPEIIDFRLNVVDMAALATAVVSIWIAIREVRLNNTVAITVEDASESTRRVYGFNNEQPFHEFRVLIRNRGVTLHGVKARIEFAAALPQTGWLAIPLTPNGEVVGDGQFARGMIAEFRWRSCDVDATDTQMLKALKNSREQNAVVRIYSQNYLAWTKRVAGVVPDCLKYLNRWLHLANRQSLYSIGKSTRGGKVYAYRYRLPTFVDIETPLKRFIESISETVVRPEYPPNPWHIQ
jgi:hypothetical protein